MFKGDILCKTDFFLALVCIFAFLESLPIPKMYVLTTKSIFCKLPESENMCLNQPFWTSAPLWRHNGGDLNNPSLTSDISSHPGVAKLNPEIRLLLCRNRLPPRKQQSSSSRRVAEIDRTPRASRGKKLRLQPPVDADLRRTTENRTKRAEPFFSRDIF